MRTLIFSCLLAVSTLVQTGRPAFAGAYAPQDPASSLDALLRDIWAQGIDKAYTLYVGKPRIPMDPAARQAFPQEMLDLAGNANVGGIILQKAKMEVYPQSHLPAAEQMSGAFFVHFFRPDMKGSSINERIYINVHPDHAAQVMGFVVRELLKSESFAEPGGVSTKRGIMEAKVAGPEGLETRADSIVIYARSLADVDWGLERLSEYQASHRDHFLKELPAATRPRLIGVSTAAEPAPSLNSGSFGLYLTHAAQAAMSQQPPPADFADFRRRVRAVMTAQGVDPDHPDRLTRRP
jgi:hypothetical protein